MHALCVQRQTTAVLRVKSVKVKALRAVLRAELRTELKAELRVAALRAVLRAELRTELRTELKAELRAVLRTELKAELRAAALRAAALRAVLRVKLMRLNPAVLTAMVNRSVVATQLNRLHRESKKQDIKLFPTTSRKC